MKVKDEAEWQLFCAEIANAPDAVAEPFRDFLVAWAEAAEDWMGRRGGPGIVALRNSLRTVEAERGRWTVGFLGQMLVVLSTHWEPAGEPDLFFDHLTPIEQNLFADVAQLKMEELARAAEPGHDH